MPLVTYHRSGVRCWVDSESAALRPRAQSPGPSTLTGSHSARVLVGNRRLMAEHDVALRPDVLEWLRTQEGTGATCILVAASDRCAPKP